MQLASLLERTGSDTLTALIGAPAVRLARLLDESLVAPDALPALATKLHEPQTLLADEEKRTLLFDTLRSDEARELALALDLPAGSRTPREALKSMSVRRGSRREQHLFDYFLLDLPRRTSTNERAPALQTCTPGYGLFPHQRRAAQAVEEHLAALPHRTVLHMPTGAGKTRTAMHVLARHLRSASEDERRLVIWLAYGRELCEQAAETFEEAWHHLGDRPVDVHRFWGSRDLDLEAVSEGIVVTSLPKMHAAAKRSIHFIGQLGSRCTLAVIDEAHQAVAETYRLVLDALVVHRAETGLLGLTATPGRTWSDISADKELADFFDRQKVSLDIEGYDNPVRFLTDEGYLADAHFNPLFAKDNLALSRKERERVAQNLRIPPNVLKRLAEDEQRNLSIAERLEALLSRHRRVLFFATTVAHAELMAAVLQARGHDVAAITAGTPPAARSRRIRRFKRADDTPRLLANYGVLTTGFDAPQTSAALVARPTRSLVLYSQMIGRAIRGPKAGGNAEAEIVTVIDRALPGFGSVADAFLNWEDVWN